MSVSNADFYGDDLITILIESIGFAVVDGEPKRCYPNLCKICEFNDVCPSIYYDNGHKDSEEYKKAMYQWLTDEYTAPVPFKRGEIVEVSLDGRGWSLAYFIERVSNVNDIGYEYRVTRQKDSEKVGYVCRFPYCRKYGSFGKDDLEADGKL